MSTKTTKRKRTASAALEAPATLEAAIPAGADTAAAPDAQPVSKGDSLATSSPVVSLFSNSTVKDAGALKDTLLQVLDSPDSVAIDAKSVERIDTAVIQVLCAFVRDRAARQRTVTWRGAPQPLLDAVRLLGVGEMLALPSEASEA